MRRASFTIKVGVILLAIASLASPGVAPGQVTGQEKTQPSTPKIVGSAKVDAGIQAIEEDYNRQLLQLDKSRLEQLGRLAAGQKPADAAATYERLFRLAVAGSLFRDAEAAAVNVLKQGTPSPTTNALAHLVKILAETDRGAYEQSLQSLRLAVSEGAQDRKPTGSRANLASDEIIGISESYYQRLVENNQFKIAREAFGLLVEQPFRPAVKDVLASRLKRIELVGKPAPPILGTDLDGKAFDLAAEKGKLVLVVFWATWCVPNAEQIGWLEEVEHTYHDKGLRVVGIDVDTMQNGGQKPEAVLPNVRRFLLDYNVPWPTLLNGVGDRDYAMAYGISDIPANVLIGRDGTVVQIDLSRRNLEEVVERQLAR